MAIPSASPATPTPHRWTVDEYYRMAEVGILGPEERLELIDGDILCVPRQTPRHSACIMRIHNTWMEFIKGVAMPSVRSPLRIDIWNEPEPDLKWIVWRDDYYTSRHPIPSDVLLLIEVADSSLEFDRQVKVPLYGRVGVQELWIANLVDDQVEVWRDPTPGGFGTSKLLKRGASIRPLAFPDLLLRSDDILI